MKVFSIYEGKIKIGCTVVEEVPEPIREAVHYFTEDGKYCIEVILWADGALSVRVNGILPSMPPEKYADYDRYKKYAGMMKNYLTRC